MLFKNLTPPEANEVIEDIFLEPKKRQVRNWFFGNHKPSKNVRYLIKSDYFKNLLSNEYGVKTLIDLKVRRPNEDVKGYDTIRFPLADIFDYSVNSGPAAQNVFIKTGLMEKLISTYKEEDIDSIVESALHRKNAKASFPYTDSKLVGKVSASENLEFIVSQDNFKELLIGKGILGLQDINRRDNRDFLNQFSKLLMYPKYDMNEAKKRFIELNIMSPLISHYETKDDLVSVALDYELTSNVFPYVNPKIVGEEIAEFNREYIVNHKLFKKHMKSVYGVKSYDDIKIVKREGYDMITSRKLANLVGVYNRNSPITIKNRFKELGLNF
ncbi:MAG: hypothetical protein PF569_01110 [Candidatus Woesearchaeota archaeon]|jgi:hypothetical protein|nr:hypothetical protein [Candidatus Woesearchaeota archaeon]